MPWQLFRFYVVAAAKFEMKPVKICMKIDELKMIIDMAIFLDSLGFLMDS